MPDLQRLGFWQARVNGTLVLDFIGLACGASGIRGAYAGRTESVLGALGRSVAYGVHWGK
jgi:hypothetical protein